MRTLGLTLLLLGGLCLAGPSWAACTQSCDAQDFSTDPFTAPGGATPRWTIVNSAGRCPIVWDPTAGTLKRTVSGLVGSNCNNTDAYVRYNGDIAQNACAIFQVVNDDDGTGATTGFEAGVVFRDQFIEGPNLPHHNEVRCEQGLDCGELRYSSDTLDYDFISGECNTMAPIVEGGYMGLCVAGVNTGTVVTAFNFAAAPASGPATTAGGGGWGAPACTFTLPLSPFGADDYGNFFGIWMRTNTVVNGAVYEVDNFRTYSCQ